MAALDVLPPAKAKEFVQIPAAVTSLDDELVEFIGAAVERVERHLGRALDPAAVTFSELLAAKMVLGEYWRTQRATRGGRGSYGGGASGAAIEVDADPAGMAPLRLRLTELLGEPAPTSGGLVPSGSFPAAAGWPDPARVARPPW